MIYAIKKVRYKKPYLLTMVLIIVSNIMIVFKFFGDQQSPLIQVQFLYTIALSFGIRLTSFFLVSLITLISTVAFLQIRLTVIVEDSAG